MDLRTNPDPQDFIVEMVVLFGMEELTLEQAQKAIQFLIKYGAHDTTECFDYELQRAIDFARKENV